MKKTTHPEVINEREFSRPADELLAIIHEYYKARDGEDLPRKEAIKIAVEILESRG